MKLIDLYERKNIGDVEDDNFNDDISDDGIQRIFSSGDVKMLGAGSYAIVYDVPHEVNTVVKTSKKPVSAEDMENDPYFHYLDIISGEVEKTQNPYLPRIHEIKFKKNKNDAYLFAVKLEKLHSGKKIVDLFGHNEAIDHIVNLSEKLFKKPLFDDDVISDAKRDKNTGVLVMLDSLGDELTEALTSLGRIADPQLKDALKIIKKVIRKHPDFHSDLINSENIMYRLTPYGLQPVFTDPVFLLVSE